MVFGVSSWRGFRLSFTDGMCSGCAVRFRRQWNLPLPSDAAAPFAPAIVLIRTAAVIVMATLLILAARPVGDDRVPAAVSRPPETILVPPTIVEEAMPAPATPSAPRGARTSRRLVVQAAPAGSVEPAPEPARVPTEIVVLAVAPAPPIPSAATIQEAPRKEPRIVAVPHAGLTQQTP
jgi:hypothetical protein